MCLKAFGSRVQNDISNLQRAQSTQANGKNKNIAVLYRWQLDRLGGGAVNFVFFVAFFEPVTVEIAKRHDILERELVSSEDIK